METRTRTSGPSPTEVAAGSGEELFARYRALRAATESLCEPLEIEDYVVQSMPDASPIRWHLAHTSWFFETFLLRRKLAGYRTLDPSYELLFNSYYNAIGEQFSRAQRGLLTRPTVREIYAYRAHVDRGMEQFLHGSDAETLESAAPVVELGLSHEEQHQELMLTDLKHLFSIHPLGPSYARGAAPNDAEGRLGEAQEPARWIEFSAGLRALGHAGPGFAFDNESPRHERHLEAFRLAARPVTEGEFLAFVEAGGYERPELWLADGFALARAEGWAAPLYWSRSGGEWKRFTLRGIQPLDPARPVSHVSYYEADAYAEWAGARLPTEAEWEVASERAGEVGAFAEDRLFDPRPLCAAPAPEALARMYGDVWEWTASAYEPYPRYRPTAGALGEYNGKFMCNQLVLRGGSCATPRGHVRPTYRNFFYPHQRWQFSGLRLAADA